MNDLVTFPKVNAEKSFSTHFGIIPTDGSSVAPILEFDDRSYSDPEAEELFWQGPGATSWVSGSWSCWGPKDQETEGDNSLHVVVYTETIPDKTQVYDFYLALCADVVVGRVLDYALIGSPDDDSIIIEVVTFIGNPNVVSFKVLQDELV